MATRQSRWNVFVFTLVGSIVPITAQAQSNMAAPQNQLRSPQADAMRQPIDPNSQRGQQPGIAGGAQRVPPGQANQPSGGTLPNGAPAQPQPLYAAPPFVLSPQEEAELDGLLKAWEKQSQGVKYFYCEFNRLEYNPAFAGGNPNQLTTESQGVIKFAAPDKGLFRVTAISNYVLDPKTRKYAKQEAAPTEWWTCDGKSMFQVDADKKEVLETPLPPQMQGIAIADGPLPFVFGAKAEALKQRYFIKNITNTVAQKDAATSIWLEVRPKLQKDAANFSMVELIFSKQDMQLTAMQIFNPGANAQNLSRTVITFVGQKINDPWAPLKQMLSDFSRPNPYPFNYTHKLQTPAPQGPTNGNGPGNAQVPAQAARTQPPKR
jgi:TIGR03009 family protein